jgi:hypothetical protein
VTIPDFVGHTSCEESGHYREPSRREEKESVMNNLLWGIAALFLILWVLGFAMNFTLNGFIHVLLVLAVVTVVVRLVTGRRLTA